METYFRSTDNSNWGMVCEGEADMGDVFGDIKEIQQKSFQDLGGKYAPRDKNETTCAIRLPPNVFFEVK